MTKLLIKLIENREKDKAFKLWLLELQNNKDTPNNFEDYWQKSIKTATKNKSEKEILTDVENILAKFRGMEVRT